LPQGQHGHARNTQRFQRNYTGQRSSCDERLSPPGRAPQHFPFLTLLPAHAQEGDTLVLVQEYVPNGDLLALMQSHGGRVDEATVVKAVLRPLLGALMYLHRWGIVHRDVKVSAGASGLHLLLARRGHRTERSDPAD
jgi:serine/threonine protein kinase